MVTYTDVRGSSVSSVAPGTPLAPGDAMIYDPQGNAFITAQSNAEAMTRWLAQRASGDVTTPCPMQNQSTVQPVAPGTQLLPGNVWVTDRYGNRYQTEAGMAAGLQKVVDSRSEPLPYGYQYISVGGQQIKARSDLMQALNNPADPKFHQAQSYYSGLLSSHGFSQRTGEDTSPTGNRQDRDTRLWSKNPANPVSFREQAEIATRDRPNYYGLPGEGMNPARTVGDSKSAMLAESLYFLSKYGGVGGFNTRERATAVSLEAMRATSYGSGNTRAAQYYSNELQKTVSRPIEKASEYHFLAQRSGIAVPANPWEYQADLAVEFLKGAPDRASERFSPVSGEMSQNLPSGALGLQDWSWNVALNTDRPDKYARPANDSFMPGVMALGAAEGRYGPYGTLFGGPDYRGTPSSDGIRKQPDFIYTADARANVAQAVQVANAQRAPEPVSRDIPYLVINNAMGMGSGNGPRLKGSGMVGGAMTVTQATEAAATPRAAGNFFGDVEGFFRGAPVLSFFYGLGRAAPSDASDKLQSFLKTAPVFESIYRGGSAFGLKGEYEKQSTEARKRLDPMLTAYEGDVGAYDRDLAGYNTRVKAYENNKTEAGYWSLVSEERGLVARKANLDTQRANIDAQIAPITALETRYKAAAAGMTGNVKQEGLLTFGLGSWFGGVGKGYQDVVETPFNKFAKGFGILGDFAGGVVSTPRAVLDIGKMGLIGGETIFRSASNAPGLAAAGTAMQVQGMKEQAETNPAGLVGSIAGMFLVGAAAGAVTTRAIGAVRTAGKGYVPIETIGYDARFGYPVKPGSATAGNLIKGFGEGKLYPSPKRMSVSETVPYLHGEAGAPLARLPGAKPGKVTLWTAHESPSLAGRTKVGDVYTMTGKGSSELDAVSAAPVLEGYFAKVGGQIHKFIGVQSPFKRPTAYSTIVDALETVPARVKARLPRNAKGDVTDYSVVNRYMQTRLARNPDTGTGFVPMLKGEYEANLATGSRFEVTGRNYYTKLGGFGQNHLLGTRVPIIEQKMIGFRGGVQESQVPVRDLGYSYRKGPMINLFYGYPAALGVSTTLAAGRSQTPSVVYTNQMGYPYGGSSKTGSKATAAYSYPSSDGLSRTSRPDPRSRLPSETYSKRTTEISSMVSRERSALTELSNPSSGLSPSSVSLLSYYKTTAPSTPRSGSTPSYPSYVYGGSRYPRSPGTSRLTPPGSPRYPGTPTPTTPGTPGIILLPYWGRGAADTYGRKKRFSRFVETLVFEVGRRRNTIQKALTRSNKGVRNLLFTVQKAKTTQKGMKK